MQFLNFQFPKFTIITAHEIGADSEEIQDKLKSMLNKFSKDKDDMGFDDFEDDFADLDIEDGDDDEDDLSNSDQDD